MKRETTAKSIQNLVEDIITNFICDANTNKKDPKRRTTDASKRLI